MPVTIIVTVAALLESTVAAVRRAIGDAGRESRLIQTRQGRGYRFVAAVQAAHPPAEASAASPLTPLESAADGEYDVATLLRLRPSHRLVGRDPELAHLQVRWAHARAGQRQVVFLSGEPGWARPPW